MRLPPHHPSPRNWSALLAIADHLHTFQVAPTLDELAAQLGLRAASAARAHVLRLERLGFITFQRTEHRANLAARSIRLTAHGQTALHTYRAMQQANLLRGTLELSLTAPQMERARAADIPIDAFPQHHDKTQTLLRCLNWQERNYWGEKILQIL